jgi:hypothetical protein
MNFKEKKNFDREIRYFFLTKKIFIYACAEKNKMIIFFLIKTFGECAVSVQKIFRKEKFAHTGVGAILNTI